MATNIQELVSDVDLTIFSRLVPESVANPLTSVLPNREIAGRKSRAAKHQRQHFTAKYRSYNAEAPIGKRGDSITVTEFSLPPISEKLPVNEELVHQLNENPSETNVDRLVEQTYDDVTNITRSIRNRAEKARGEFLATGKISINENGVVDEADFGLPVSHQVTAPVLWNDPAAPIVEQEIAYVEVVTTDAEVAPTRATVSRRIQFAMLRNEQYRSYFWQRTDSDPGPTLNPVQLNQVREAFGLPALNVYDGVVPDNAGGSVRVIADNLYILTTDTVGESQWGTTAEALTLVGSNAVDFTRKDAPGLTIVQYAVPDPVITWTKGSSVFLPIAGDINGLFVATVLPA